MPKTIIVMPAYNAEKTLEKTVRDIPSGTAREIILGDDGSTDGTVALAKRLGLQIIRHEKNRGYGANQKSCYDEALKKRAEIIIMIHPDYQYDSRFSPLMKELLELGSYDIILGSRIRTRTEALASGMPGYKYIANRLLTVLENIVLGLNLSEFHTGYRVYSRKVLETIPYHDNSDGFIFDSEMLIQAAYFGFRIGELPVPCRYFEEVSQISLAGGIGYALGTLITLGKYILQRSGLARFKIFQKARKQEYK